MEEKRSIFGIIKWYHLEAGCTNYLVVGEGAAFYSRGTSL